MKSFKQYLTEARPKGQKRYDRDTSKLETRLDRMYAAGGSQKKIDRAEMRLARRTNEGDYDIDDQRLPTTKERPDLPLEDSPRSQSVVWVAKYSAQALSLPHAITRHQRPCAQWVQRRCRPNLHFRRSPQSQFWADWPARTP